MDVLIVRPILCTAEALCLPYTAGLKTGNGMDTLLDTLCHYLKEMRCVVVTLAHVLSIMMVYATISFCYGNVYCS